jgi:branched-chain amino acid transport system permease protein
MDQLVGILFHGVASAMLLYMISVGLAVTMGLMNFVNLAHGVFAMAGGYIAIGLMQRGGIPFVGAVILASLAVVAASVLIERVFYARLYRAPELTQVLLTMGLIFIATAAAKYFFGPAPQNIQAPGWLSGQLPLGATTVPAYRTMIIVLGVLVALGVWLLVERTSLGARLRAAVDNRTMAETVGIRTDRVFTLTFALGSGLAALGGAVGAEILPMRPTYALEMLVSVLIVVSVGGLGSLSGPFIAALLLGITDTSFKYLFPQLGGFFIYAAMLLLLLWRPRGLFGRR